MLRIEPFHCGDAPQHEKVPELFPWGFQHLARKMNSKAVGRTTRPSFYALIQKYNVFMKLLHWPAVPHMKKSIAQELFGAIIQLQPLPWDDSLARWSRWCMSFRLRGRMPYSRQCFLSVRYRAPNGHHVNCNRSSETSAAPRAYLAASSVGWVSIRTEVVRLK